MRFATYTAATETFYGVITDAGAIALSPEFPEWPTLREVIENKGLHTLAQAAQGRDVTHSRPDHLSDPGAPPGKDHLRRRQLPQSQRRI